MVALALSDFNAITPTLRNDCSDVIAINNTMK
jgi:hypothetical protein